jgi:hypothetical protein
MQKSRSARCRLFVYCVVDREKEEASIQELESTRRRSARTYLVRLHNQTGSPCVLEPHGLDFSITILILSGVLCPLVSLYNGHCYALSLVFTWVFNKDMGVPQQGESQKGGRSRRFGGEMHGRKLTKDAINVFSQATNSRRTKSWLDTGLVWHLTARNRSHLIIRHTGDI